MQYFADLSTSYTAHVLATVVINDRLWDQQIGLQKRTGPEFTSYPKITPSWYRTWGRL